MQAFGNLLRPPADHEAYQYNRAGLRAPGTVPSQTDLGFEAQMRWLSQRYLALPPDSGLVGTIPSGFVYLAQFAAHDMVATASQTEFWRIGHPGGVNGNERGQRLMLDVLYCNETLFDAGRFRIGKVRDGVTGRCRDILRAGGSARVADPRNDDHAIIAQLTALMMLAHNSLIDLLPAGTGTPDARRQWARDVLTLLYRAIIRHDLLPRILDAKVWSAYAGAAAPLLGARGDDPLPVEFAHAAFRFGHSMLRGTYAFNTANTAAAQPLHAVLGLTSSRPSLREPKLPFSADWVVDWSLFFPLDARSPQVNLALPIGPHYQAVLGGKHGVGDPGDKVAAEIPLPLRDLLASGNARPWSVPALIDAIGNSPGGQALLSPWLAQESWHAELSAWLNRAPGMPAGFVNSIARDPPLAFFVLYEAAFEMVGGQPRGGRSLGTLASIIVAEAMCAMLADGPPAATNRAALATALEGTCNGLPGSAAAIGGLPADLVSDTPTMAALARFVAGQGSLLGADPAFA